MKVYFLGFMTLVAVVSNISPSAFAVTESSVPRLRCWDIYSPRGSAPVVTASILSNSEINNVIVQFQNSNSERALSKSGKSLIEAVLFSRKPYGTVNQYLIYPERQNPYQKIGPLMLPTDLSPSALTTSIIPSQNPRIRRNGVLSGWTDSQGDGTRNWVIHLHCVSSVQ